MTENQQVRNGLSWQDDVPVSAQFQDPYFSTENGLEETRHTYLRGNGLPDRLVAGFHVGELGFGTGLNLMALAAIAHCPIQMTSFEAFPLTHDDLARATARWQDDLGPIRDQLLSAYVPAGGQMQVGNVTLNLVLGEAATTLPTWRDRADAWFLDGFAPARNPELWSDTLMHQVASHTAPGGTFATYTCAGAVRRALKSGGFTVRKIPGYGRKREMSVGWFETEPNQTASTRVAFPQPKETE